MPVGGETPGRVHRRRGGGGHRTEREGRRGRHREDRNRQGAEEGADPTARHDGEETPEQHPLPDASRREKGRPRPPRPPWRADVGRGGKHQPTGEGSRLEHGQQSLVHAPHAHLCKSAAAGGGGVATTATLDLDLVFREPSGRGQSGPEGGTGDKLPRRGRAEQDQEGAPAIRRSDLAVVVVWGGGGRRGGKGGKRRREEAGCVALSLAAAADAAVGGSGSRRAPRRGGGRAGAPESPSGGH